LAVPGVVAALVEPWLALFSDTGRRRRVVIGGGAAFAGSLLLFAASPNLTTLLIASCVLYPASGAFVALTQATWIDLEPAAAERTMARWVLAGSIGAVVGPIALGAAVALGGGWRAATAAAAIATIPVVLAVRHVPFPAPHPEIRNLRAAIRGAMQSLRTWRVLRWLTLLEFADLLQDVFLGFLALYLVDVTGATPAAAAVAVGMFVLSGLIGDALLLLLLRRVAGIRSVRWSATLALLVYPAFLLAAPGPWKLALLVGLGLVRAGWYAILQAQLYAELPARGGTAIAIGAPADLVGSALPIAIGAAAQAVGLGPAMWLVLAGPVVLVALLPRTGATVDG
jgi:FSR family fosmidomycin resistance protein-like MFS transporter